MAHSQLVAGPDVLHIDSIGDFAKQNADIKCHYKAAGICGGGPEMIGRSHGGLTTKIHHASRFVVRSRGDSLGFVHRLLTSPGQRGDCTYTEALTVGLQPLAVVSDKEYDTDRLRAYWQARGIGVCIWPKSNRLVRHRYDKALYCTQYTVENPLCRLKDHHHLSPGLNETKTSFGGFAAALLNVRLKIKLCLYTSREWAVLAQVVENGLDKIIDHRCPT